MSPYTCVWRLSTLLTNLAIHSLPVYCLPSSISFHCNNNHKLNEWSCFANPINAYNREYSHPSYSCSIPLIISQSVYSIVAIVKEGNHTEVMSREQSSPQLLQLSRALISHISTIHLFFIIIIIICKHTENQNSHTRREHTHFTCAQGTHVRTHTRGDERRKQMKIRR